MMVTRYLDLALVDTLESLGITDFQGKVAEIGNLYSESHTYTLPLLLTTVKALREAVGEYIEEEMGHQEWILNDLAAYGADKESARHSKPAASTVALTLRLLPVLKQQGQSYLVNVGSVYGSIGFPSQALYCASKFGLKGFTESLFRELSGSGTNVMYFAPRATETSINAGEASALNDALGTAVDSPEWVAGERVKQIEKQQPRKTLGWPERFFVKMNAVFPSIVDSALVKQLPIIKLYANFAVLEAK